MSKEPDIGKITDLIGKRTAFSESITSGHHKSSVFANNDDSARTAELDKVLSDLELLVTEDQFPPCKFTMAPMSCIKHNPDSDFTKKNVNMEPKDNWWSHLKLAYELGSYSVPSSTPFAVNYCCYGVLHGLASAHQRQIDGQLREGSC